MARAATTPIEYQFNTKSFVDAEGVRVLPKIFSHRFPYPIDRFVRTVFATAATVLSATSLSPSALAQPASPSITLSCSAPVSRNTADLTTKPGVWRIDYDGLGWAPAVYFHDYWAPWHDLPSGDHWIGAYPGTNPEAVAYSVLVMADDPNIDLSSAKITYSYLVDNSVTRITWNGVELPSSSATGFQGTPYILPTPATVPLASGLNRLLFVTSNQVDPFGLSASVTLTFNCGTPVSSPQPVPANPPWALVALSGLMAACVVGMRRRGRMKGQ